MIKLKKTIGILLLCFWVPVIFALAFPAAEDGWYTVAGFMIMIFGTWGGILLVKED